MVAMSTSSNRSAAGALVHERRIRLGLTQRAAAAACGVPQSMLSRIESGETQPSVATLERILAGLGVGLELALVPLPGAVEGRREKQRSVWLNRAVIGELVRDPERVVAIARENIARWCQVHAERPAILAALQRWSEILDEGVDAIVTTLSAPSEDAADLRQNAPFAGVLTPEQREQVLTSFRADWERHHPAPAAGQPGSTVSR